MLARFGIENEADLSVAIADVEKTPHVMRGLPDGRIVSGQFLDGRKGIVVIKDEQASIRAFYSEDITDEEPKPAPVPEPPRDGASADEVRHKVNASSAAANQPLKLDDRSLIDRTAREFDAEFRQFSGAFRARLDYRRIAPTKEHAIRGFVGAALSGRLTPGDDYRAELVLGAVRSATANKLGNVVSENFHNFVHTVSSDALAHIIKRHFGANENDPRNIPLTIDILSQYINIINNPNTTITSEIRKNKLHLFYKLDQGDKIFIVETIGGAKAGRGIVFDGSERRVLRLKTMYANKK